jgi:hypothetical protein
LLPVIGLQGGAGAQQPAAVQTSIARFAWLLHGGYVVNAIPAGPRGGNEFNLRWCVRRGWSLRRQWIRACVCQPAHS